MRFLPALALLVALATPVLAQTSAPNVAPPKAPATAPVPKPAAAPVAAAPAKAAPLLDLNSASEAELGALKGIGPARAKAIVAGRPYKGKDELAQKKVIPLNVYEDIKGQVIAKQK